MKNCKECSSFELIKKDGTVVGWNCNMPIYGRNAECCCRQIVSLLHGFVLGQQLMQKTIFPKMDKFIDRASRDLDEGEEWKK